LVSVDQLLIVIPAKAEVFYNSGFTTAKLVNPVTLL